MIPRSDLPAWYEKSASAGLVLFRAPAGFGKTTALLQWLERAREEGKRAAWLTLDPGDNDPARFLAYLGAAFQGLDATLNLGFGSNLGMAGGPAVATLLSNLREWIEAAKAPFVLFLDEFEAIQNTEIHEIVGELLESLPPCGQVVLATRETPELPLARMRAREQLAKIGIGQLRFNLEETEQFLQQKGSPKLDREDAVRLQQRTEGWAAGLQLARLALTGRQDARELVQSLSGSFVDIADYLWEEVVARQPEKVRDFLLKTSILDRLSGPLCDAVTGGEGGYDMLARLERANLFLTPLDDERRWYRYHNLFAQFLKARLTRNPEHSVAGLHSAAADWFEKKGSFEAAAEHALAAGAAGRAAGLMAQCARGLVNLGQMDTVLRWAERLPRDALEKQPGLWVAHCWALVFGGRDYQEAHASITRLCEAQTQLEDPAVRDEAAALEGVLLSFEERIDEAYRVGSENLPKISDRGSFAFGVLGDALTACLIWAGKLKEAEQCLARVRESQSPTEISILTVYRDSAEGFLLLIQGRLREALFLHRRTYDRALEAFPSHSLARAVAGASLAQALIEADEVDEAETLFADHLSVLREHRPLDLAVESYRQLSRICFRRGRKAEAERLLDEADQLLGKADRLSRAQHASSLGAAVCLERIRLALRRGDLLRAERDVADLDKKAAWNAFRSRPISLCEPDTPDVLRLRVMIAKGEARRALSELKSLLPAAKSSGRLRLALTLSVLEAAALDACGQRRAALRVLKPALQFGYREGFILAFADEGPGVTRLIEALRDVCFDEGDSALADLPSAYLDRILSAAGSPRAPAPDVPSAPVVALTKRELEVLTLSALSLSNQETADRLFVSLATVKSHLANITAKLGVANRRRAVSKARRLGLLKS